MAELVDLEKLGSVFSAAANSVGKLAESIAKAVRLSNQGYDALRARREKARLKRISRKIVDVGRSNTGNIEYIKSSIKVFDDKGWVPAHYWKRSLGHFDKSLREVETFLRRLRSERSDFVLEDTYQEIVFALESRRQILLSLTAQPAPGIPEIYRLWEFLDEYERLRSELMQARRALSDYVKSRAPHTPAGVRKSSSKPRRKRRTPKLGAKPHPG